MAIQRSLPIYLKKVTASQLNERKIYLAGGLIIGEIIFRLEFCVLAWANVSLKAVFGLTLNKDPKKPLVLRKNDCQIGG